MTLQHKSPCPECFGESGHSIVMKEDRPGIWQCPNHRDHRFKKDDDGFWVKMK